MRNEKLGKVTLHKVNRVNGTLENFYSNLISQYVERETRSGHTIQSMNVIQWYKVRASVP